MAGILLLKVSPPALLWQAQFEEEMVIIHEQTKEREEEIQGGWYTEERMATELKYSKMLN